VKSLVKKEFGRRLKVARKESGLTQTRLGELLGGLDFTTISRWESGKFAPDEEHFTELCKVLAKPSTYFTGAMSEPPRTVGELTRIIEGQEDRIRALEAQLAAHRVQDQERRQDRSTSPSGRKHDEPGGEFQDIFKELSGDPAKARQVRLLLGLAERPKKIPDVAKNPLKKDTDSNKP
jgi:transcriptional regulator with XRE-family HTH domain